MENRDRGRGGEVVVVWTLLTLVVAVVVAGFALVAWVTYVAPLQVAALQRAGATTLPPTTRVLIQISNWITVRWYLVIPLLALVLALILSGLTKR